MLNTSVSRREFFGLLASVGAMSNSLALPQGTSASLPEARPPNILLITSDDHGRADLGCYGNTCVKTPHIDALARQGVCFDRAFTVTAVCTPSRTCLFTGLYPHSSGSYGFENLKHGVRVLPEYLSEAGYRTGCVGKLHLQPKTKSKTFDSYIGWVELGQGRDVLAYEREVTTFLTAADDRPFFLQVGFCDPHRPFPEPGVKEGKKREVPHPHDPADVWSPPSLANTPEVRKELARYYDAIHRLDEGVGRVLRVLDDAGHGTDTLVIYVSDHGRAFPFSKTTLYDEGLNVPMIVRWPGRSPAGVRTDAMVHFVDFVPTFLDVAGVAKPDLLQGKSFAGVLEGKAKTHREIVFGSHTTHFYRPSCPSRSIRDERYHYIYNIAAENEFRSDSLVGATYEAMRKASADNPALARRLDRLKFRPVAELYDVRADPHEMTNLADAPGHAETRARMHARLATFMKDIEDPWLDVLLDRSAVDAAVKERAQ